ncbi:MAG: hypothetical protein LUG45_00990 [Clostridiales bacterium]|nr:hypothetical protein [Clostridiales bacterium]
MTRSELDALKEKLSTMKTARAGLAEIQELVDSLSDSLTLAKLKAFLTSLKEILANLDT